MPGSTPVYGLPYQTNTDAPDGPALGENLALAVETELERIDNAMAELRFPTAVTVQAEQTAAITGIGSTSYTTTGGAVCGTPFIAPQSGKVMIHIAAELDNTSSVTLVSFRLGTGATIGAGTAILTPSDDRSISNTGTDQTRYGVPYLVSGLTAGDDYNVRLEHRITAGGSGTVARRVLIVQPVP